MAPAPSIKRNQSSHGQDVGDKGRPVSDPVREESKRRIAKEGADLHGHNPSRRTYDTHPCAAAIEGSREIRGKPGKQAPVTEEHTGRQRGKEYHAPSQRGA